MHDATGILKGKEKQHLKCSLLYRKSSSVETQVTMSDELNDGEREDKSILRRKAHV